MRQEDSLWIGNFYCFGETQSCYAVATSLFISYCAYGSSSISTLLSVLTMSNPIFSTIKNRLLHSSITKGNGTIAMTEMIDVMSITVMASSPLYSQTHRAL